MPQKNETLKARVSASTRSKFEALATAEGMTVSDLLRLMIDQVAEDVEAAEDAQAEPVPKRESKVTVRLPDDVAGHLAEGAREQGVTASTWAATILMAKFRNAPQAVKPQKKAIRRAFRQLRGMAANTNQMAAVMNRGVFVGSGYALNPCACAALCTAPEWGTLAF